MDVLTKTHLSAHGKGRLFKALAVVDHVLTKQQQHATLLSSSVTKHAFVFVQLIHYAELEKPKILSPALVNALI